MRNRTKRKIIFAELVILCTLLVAAVTGVFFRTFSYARGSRIEDTTQVAAPTLNVPSFPDPNPEPDEDSGASTGSATDSNPTPEPVEGSGGDTTVPEPVEGQGGDTTVPEPVEGPRYTPYEPAQVRYDLSYTQDYGSSYGITMQMSADARAYVENAGVDCSSLTIACIGDSITRGVGAESGYPDTIWRMLAPFELYNLGLGGSPIATLPGGATSIVARYPEIPEDTDVIIVFGGTNDSFMVTDETYGSVGNRETFCGDLDHLMERLVNGYPDAKVFVVVPMPAMNFDDLKEENPYLLTQEVIRQEILNRAAAYGVEVIDLYDADCLNPYDQQVRDYLFYDGCHPNDAGYEIIGEIIASRIVSWMQSR